VQPDAGADAALPVPHPTLGVRRVRGGTAHASEGTGLPAVPGHESPDPAPGIDRVGRGTLGPPHGGQGRPSRWRWRGLRVQPTRPPDPRGADVRGQKDPGGRRVLGRADRDSDRRGLRIMSGRRAIIEGLCRVIAFPALGTATRQRITDVCGGAGVEGAVFAKGSADTDSGKDQGLCVGVNPEGKMCAERSGC